MGDTVGSVISQFVEQRTATPPDGGIDAWVEAVAGGLFAAGVSVVMLTKEVRQSPEAMEGVCNGFCQDAAAHASEWMNRRLSPKGIKGLFPGHVCYDFRDVLLARLAGYFELYFTAVESGMLHKEARWQALHDGLGIAADMLPSRGLLLPGQESAWIGQVTAHCKQLVQGLPEYAR